MHIGLLFKQHWHNLRTVGRAHPLETFWLAVFALPLLLLPSSMIEHRSHWLIWWLPFLPYQVVMYRLRRHRGAYLAAGLLPLIGSGVLYALWANPDWHNTIALKLFLLNILALFVLLFDWSLKPNRAFLWRGILTLANIVSALLVSGCLMLALGLIDASINILFETQSALVFSPKIYYVPLFVLTPLMFLSFERPLQQVGGESLLLQNRVIEISLNYIAAPMLLVFTLLIYVYTAKIIWQGELPNGGVAFIVCTYLAAGLMTQMLHELSCQAKWQWFHRWFASLTLLPLALLWTGISTRINTYGLTEARIWLLAIALLLTVFCLLSLRPHWRQYRLFAVLLTATGLLVGIILPLEKIAAANQQARFETMLNRLNLLTADGKIIHPLPPKQPETESEWQQISAQINHLGLSIEAGNARYGEGYAALLSDAANIEESSDDDVQNKLHLRIDIGNKPFHITGAVYLQPVNYVSAVYDTESGSKITDFTIGIQNNDETTLFPSPHRHLHQVFAKHGLNPQQQYSETELARLNPDILHIPLPDGKMLLAQMVWLEYDKTQGYYISDIQGFAVLQPKPETAASESK